MTGEVSADKTYTQKELTEVFRLAIEDRAKWFYLLLKYAREEGADAESIAAKAITEFGHMKGVAIGSMPDAASFATALMKGHACQAFEMEAEKLEPSESIVKFGYCALVEAWKKLGCSEDEVADLCRLARNGDFGMVEKSPALELEFKQLISEGQDVCELRIRKK